MTEIKKKKMLTWRSFHRWVGLVFSVFIILFCVSGILMNHRHAISHQEVSRSFLPSSYNLENYRGALVRGTLPSHLGLLAYGTYGCFLTDSTFSRFSDFNSGFDKGVDNRNIKSIVEAPDGTLYAAAQNDLYRCVKGEYSWTKIPLSDNDERLSDLALRGDTLVVLTRSALYQGNVGKCNEDGAQFSRLELNVPEGYRPKVTLFKQFWELHSGALFGLPGRLVVDFLGVVLIILCLTGIYFFFETLPSSHKGGKKKSPSRVAFLKKDLKWHNRLGAKLIVLTLMMSITGMCLRPPLMVPLALTHVSPIPHTSLDNKNVFHDKLRALRWDASLGLWLISTSEGFYAIDGDLANSLPVAIPDAPAVSPMGINVFERNPESPQDEWLIGSFTGLYIWNPIHSTIIDYFTGQPYVKPTGRPIGSVMVAGYSEDLKVASPVIFDYNNGPIATGIFEGPQPVSLPETPELLAQQPMSLWNFALELHAGRCYEPFLGPISVLFIFLAGLTLTLILVSGYIIYRRTKKKI